MIEHAGAVNTVFFVLQRFFSRNGAHAQGIIGETFIFLNALHFDLSVFDIFGALGSGSRLVIPQAEQVAFFSFTFWFCINPFSSCCRCVIQWSLLVS